MKLSSFIKIMILITIISLVYIHMQSKIVEMAYHGKVREHQVKKLMEENGHLDYAITKLKSANHLGVTMLSDNKHAMKFADPKQIVLIPTSEKLSRSLAENHPLPEKKLSPLANLFSLGEEALAKAQEK